MKNTTLLAAALALILPATAHAGQANPNTTPAARSALEQWTGCIARSSAAETARVLQMDFTSTPYERALRMLSNSSKDCVKFRGTLRAGGLLFAGELAEALLETGGTPVSAALARAATKPEMKAFSFIDRVAICTVRSAPGEVAALFATGRDTPAEGAAINAVSVAMGMCAKAAEARKPLSISPAGMRAMLATAAYRQVHAEEEKSDHVQ